MKIFLKTLLSLLILAAAAGAAWHFYTTKPRPKKARPERAVPLVQTVAVRPGTESVVFETSGTVIPARKLVMRSEVEGRILEQNERLVPGGIIKKDELLIRLDARDYRFQVRERQAELATAKYELAVEQGKQTIARQEWQILWQGNEQGPGQPGSGPAQTSSSPCAGTDRCGRGAAGSCGTG